MGQSIKDITSRITESLLTMARLLAVFSRSTLLPLTGFFWHSLNDLIILINTGENRRRLGRWIRLSPMRAERRLETVLPDSLKHDKPVKSAGLLLLFLLLVLLFGDDSSIEDLKESGELVVISRESPTTLYQGNEGPAGPEPLPSYM